MRIFRVLFRLLRRLGGIMFHIAYHRLKKDGPKPPPEAYILSDGSSWLSQFGNITYSSHTVVVEGVQSVGGYDALHYTPIASVSGRTVNAQADVAIYDDICKELYLYIFDSVLGIVSTSVITVPNPVNSSTYTLSASCLLTTDMTGVLGIGIEANYTLGGDSVGKQMVATNIFMTDIGITYNDSTSDEYSHIIQDRPVGAIRYLSTISGPK
jgi:hypothetical protein